MEAMRGAFLAGTVLFLMMVPPGSPSVSVTEAPEWGSLFVRRQGWIGSDCAYSVDLGGDRILWLFDDTLYGVIESGRRKEATMAGIRNSLAIMKGRDAETAQVVFTVRKDRDGKPCSFFSPTDGDGWFWFGDGIVVRGTLFLFLWQMTAEEKPGIPEQFHFTLKQSSLAIIANAQDDPDQWQPVIQVIPFDPTDEVFWGGAVVKVGQWIYIYGLRHQLPGKKRGLIVARVPEGKMADFQQWRFYSSAGWVADHKNALTIVEDCQPEFSLSYLSKSKRFLMVYSPADLRPLIQIRMAPSPVGPWSEPVVIYHCPEPTKNSRVFCYAAKAHPEISKPDELIITYATNSFRFQDLLEDASLYFPKFLKARLLKVR